VGIQGGNFAGIPPSAHSGSPERTLDDQVRRKEDHIVPADAIERLPLDATALRDGLVGPGMPWRQLDVVDETGSTNADLIARAQGGANIDGLVLLAEYQNAGRGRHGRQWSAPPRAQIALSVGVGAASVPRSGWGWLPLATGVAIADALAAAAGVSPGLKWPNDVWVNDGKLAGILAEVAAPTSAIVLGLGLNVTLTADEAPDPAATSLLMLGSSATDRNTLARRILRELAVRIDAWRTAGGADPALLADYQRYSLTLGSRVHASLPGDREVVGIAHAVDETGRLCVDTGGQTVAISAGDITHLRPSV
jgi:BirA family transcriptional regulator, biotin operon repressor / biotin---[acetyl-CoA-carboxylase] ligase